LEEKLRALDRLAEIALSVTLVPAIERGRETSMRSEKSLTPPFSTRQCGESISASFHAGRHQQHDPMKRMTIPTFFG